MRIDNSQLLDSSLTTSPFLECIYDQKKDTFKTRLLCCPLVLALPANQGTLSGATLYGDADYVYTQLISHVTLSDVGQIPPALQLLDTASL
jgi:hypothetical protein